METFKIEIRLLDWDNLLFHVLLRPDDDSLPMKPMKIAVPLQEAQKILSFKTEKAQDNAINDYVILASAIVQGEWKEYRSNAQALKVPVRLTNLGGVISKSIDASTQEKVIAKFTPKPKKGNTVI